MIEVLYDYRTGLTGFHGIARYTRDLGLALSQRDDIALTILSGPKAALPSELAEGVRRRPIWTRSYRVGEQLELPLRSRKSDILHVPTYSAPLWHVGPLVLTLHDCTHVRFPEYGRARALYWAQLVRRVAQRRTVQVITGAEVAKRDLIDTLAMDPERIHVVSHGIYFPAPVHREPRADRLLMLASRQPHKGIELGLEAFKLAVDAGWEGRLDVIGELPPALMHVAPDLFARGIIRQHSIVSDDVRWDMVSRAAALILPSRWEGFGLPLIEALGVGCPVVAFRIPVFEELVGDVPVYAEEMTAASLAAALLHGVADPAVAERTATAAPRIRERFTWEAAARATVAVYRRALEGAS